MELNRINPNNSFNTRDYSTGDSNIVSKPDRVEGKVRDSEIMDQKRPETSQENLKKAVDIANKALFKNNTHLQFRIHERTKDVMVKIIDDNTGEVVKEIPPEKMLDMVAKLWEIAGILIDEKR